MEWTQIIEDPILQDLPYKIELNEWGNIILSPASNKHGLIQAELSGFLRANKKEGRVIIKCSIATHKGVKVADVSWGTKNFFERNGFDTPYNESPELCVEIVSPSNTNKEMQEKITLYLSKGAKEVWICHEDGLLKFYSYRGEIDYSQLFPDMPKNVDVI